MKIVLLVVGESRDPIFKKGIEEYCRRLSFYTDFSIKEVSLPKKKTSLPENVQKEEEASLVMKNLVDFDRVILLDDRGKGLRSIEFAEMLEKMMVSGVRRLAFIVGGPFGFGSAVLEKKYEKVSLSPMTFSHQMVRLVFVEQLYRAFTILRNEGYHHE